MITRRGTRILATFAILATLAACAARDEARVEAWESGAWADRPVSGFEIAGKREGAATAAVARLTLEDGDTITIEITVRYNPTPVLDSGRWHVGGDTAVGGDVVAESIKFLGGQGEGPSLGGRFRLEQNGEPRFRVSLPSRVLDRR